MIEVVYKKVADLVPYKEKDYVKLYKITNALSYCIKIYKSDCDNRRLDVLFADTCFFMLRL